MLESMMVADHGADLGGWEQSENAQLWGQDAVGTSPVLADGYLEVADRRSETPGGPRLGLGMAPLSGDLASTPRSVTNARPKRVLFDIGSPAGASPGKLWKDPTQNPAEIDEPIYSTNSTGLPADAAEFNRRQVKKDKEEDKKTMRRRMSFFNKGGKSRAKLTREQLKWAEAERNAEEVALRPDGSMPGTMARPVVLDEEAAMKMMAAASKPGFAPGGMGQTFLRKTGLSTMEDVRLDDAQRKQQWLESFNNNTVWDHNEEKWIYQKLDAWMSWGLAPREFEEPIYEPLNDVLGSDVATNYSAAGSSAPVSEFDLAVDELGRLARAAAPPAAPPAVPSTLNRAPISTLNRGPIKPPTMTVVNAGGGGLNDRILEDRPIGGSGAGIVSISGHFDPTGHSGYLAMSPEFPGEANRPPRPTFGQGPAHFHPSF